MQDSGKKKKYVQQTRDTRLILDLENYLRATNKKIGQYRHLRIAGESSLPLVLEMETILRAEYQIHHHRNL